MKPSRATMSKEQKPALKTFKRSMKPASILGDYRSD